MDNNRRNNRRRGRRDNRRESRFDSKAVSIRRVAKVTAGGKRLRFSAMVVVGDRNGTVGVALGRGVDTRSAIEKATKKAEKSAKKIQLIGDTIPHEIYVKDGASKILLRPAKPGTGVIAGSSVRTVLELCGIDNVYGKILGSNDLVGNTYATFDALTQLRSKRVLQKMDNMKKRVNLKEELDKERKKREIALRKKSKESDKKNDRKKKSRRPNKYDRKRAPKPKVDEKKTEVKVDEKPVAGKQEDKKKEVKVDTKPVAGKQEDKKKEVKVDTKPVKNEKSDKKDLDTKKE